MHLGGIMSSATKRFIADLAERAGKVFIYAYLASWVSRGVEYDTLFTQDNVSVGIARHVGSNDSASLLPANVDPPQ
jgi:hypothetical protein